MRCATGAAGGDDDELGTLNLITADKVAEAASLVRQGKVISLGGDFGSNGPQGAFKFRFNPIHVMTVDGGDAETLVKYAPEWARKSVAQELSSFFVDNIFRFNDDMITMSLQAATQWDALSHVYYEDKLYNGFPADSVTSFGAYRCGIEKVDGKGIVSRGVLLDVVAHRGEEVFCEPGRPITPAELDDIAAEQGVQIGRGDIVVVHTGWWTRFLSAGDGHEAARPALDVRLMAARSRGRGRRLRQPDGRGSGPGQWCGGHLPADAHAVPARYGFDARRVLGSDRAGRRLPRRRGGVRIPADRTPAEGGRRGRCARQPDSDQMNVVRKTIAVDGLTTGYLEAGVRRSCRAAARR